MSLNPRLPVVIALPTWDNFRRMVEQELEVHPGESAVFVGTPAQLWFPEVLLLDFSRAAEQAGMTFGQFVSYLAIQGAMRVLEQTPKPGTGVN